MKAIQQIIFLFLVFSILPTGLMAADKVVVIPLLSHQSKPIKNVVTVAKKNGDFTDPVAAMNSITDAAAGNPYLIIIAPGVYTLSQTLVMKPHVSITGSGEDVTTLTGAIGSQELENAAIIKLASSVSLSNISVHNTGNENSLVIGIYLYFQYRPTKLDNLSVRVSGNGINHYGVYLANSSITLDSVHVHVSGASEDNIGIESITVSSEGWVISNSSLILDTAIVASGGQESYALKSIQTNLGGEAHDEPVIRHSTLQGETAGISSDHFFTVNQSTLIGGIIGDNQHPVKCVACDNSHGHALDNDCSVL